MDEKLQKKTKKQIVIIILVGAVLAIIDLISSFTMTGVSIVEDNGQLYMIRPKSGASAQHLSLQAVVNGKEERMVKNYDITLYAKDDQKKEAESASDEDSLSEKDTLEYEMRSLVGAFNNDLQLERVLLPQKLNSGALVSWEKKYKTNAPILLLLTVLIASATYFNSYSSVKKQRQEQIDSVMHNLPEFVNRLVLLLNAGLVLNTAFEKTVEETMAFCKSPDDYFVTNIENVYTSVRTANGSMNQEFRNFAKASGIKEIMRISNILNDNVHKGVGLTMKLENEGQLLWMNRKKLCEERGRLAETKLTLPLVIFLMVLIVITVAPALLEL